MSQFVLKPAEVSLLINRIANSFKNDCTQALDFNFPKFLKQTKRTYWLPDDQYACLNSEKLFGNSILKVFFPDFHVFKAFVKSLQEVSASNKGHDFGFLDGLGRGSHLKHRPDDQSLYVYDIP